MKIRANRIFYMASLIVCQAVLCFKLSQAQTIYVGDGDEQENISVKITADLRTSHFTIITL